MWKPKEILLFPDILNLQKIAQVEWSGISLLR